MKEKIRQRVKEMTSLIGVSGDEWDIARYMKKQLDGFVDGIEQRPNGNLIAWIKGGKPGPRFVIGAHMDEVGFAVKTITPDGFIRFGKAGMTADALLPGRKVLVKGKKGIIPGVIGIRAMHIMTEEQAAKPQGVQQSYIDVCAESRQEVLEMGIDTGAAIVMDSPLTEMHNTDYLCGRAVDCRILCSILIEALRNVRAEDIHGELYAVFTVREETTVAGIASAVNYIKPEFGYFLDTVPCGDVPDVDFISELPLGLNRGGVLITAQELSKAMLYCTSHPKLIAAAKEAAAEVGRPLQEFAFIGTNYATDAIYASLAGEGTAVATLSVPRRYSHAPVELFCLNDAVHLEAVLEKLMVKEINLNMLS